MSEIEFTPEGIERLMRAVDYRVPFEEISLRLWGFATRDLDHSCNEVEGWLNHQADVLAARLANLGYWLNAHHLTRKRKR